MENTLINIDRVCRICLKQGNLISLFSEEIIPPSLMMMTCATVKVVSNDGLPSGICSNCIYRLNIAFQLKKQCENSDNQLRKWLGFCDLETKDIKEECIPSNSDLQYDIPFVKSDDTYDPLLTVDYDIFVETLDADSKSCPDISPVPQKQNKLEIKDNTIKRKCGLIYDGYAISNQRSMVKRLKNLKQLKEAVKCPQCNRTFDYSYCLDAHMRTHTGEKPFSCKVCSKQFTQAGNLAMHIRTHTGDKRFQCEICSKQFTTSSNLNTHLKTHTSEKNFKCNLCPRAFKSNTDLNKHAGTHTGIKEHVCNICKKAFYKTSYLTIHMKTVHIGEKKHKCSECGKEFANPSNLKCHIRTHTGEKPYACRMCSARFNQSSALQRHIKHHLTKRKTNNSTEINIICETDACEDLVISHFSEQIMFDTENHCKEITMSSNLNNAESNLVDCSKSLTERYHNAFISSFISDQ